MKSKALKIIMFAMSIVFGMSLLVGCANGCTNETPPVKYEDREVGDFVVRFYDEYCEIKGTTEQGNSKRFLVIPKYIDGVSVMALGYSSLFSGFDPSNLTVPQIESKVLEKVYFETAMDINSRSFYGCPNVRKVIYPKVDIDSYEMRGIGGITIYYPCSIYESAYGSDKGYYVTNIERANVSYHYNYENPTKDVDYYWIDDCDYGNKIEFFPPEPVKEGYTFGGWYKEPECINVWNFDSDRMPEEKTELYENQWGDIREITVYQETMLYAKWI